MAVETYAGGLDHRGRFLGSSGYSVVNRVPGVQPALQDSVLSIGSPTLWEKAGPGQVFASQVYDGGPVLNKIHPTF
jgi:hypothetical protein